MRLSTHYYVICLNGHASALFEAFRDTLIDIQNEGFPVSAATAMAEPAESLDEAERRRKFLQVVDEHFRHYYEQEPMVVVVTGEEELQTAFTSVTTHRAAIVGRVNGDFIKTSLHDLGKIVWPVVKEAMSGLRQKALRDLNIATNAQKICGLEAVSPRVAEAKGATLLVEEGYHLRGSIREADGSGTISPSVDVRDEIDDVIDVLVEKILKNDGNVVFMPDGSLRDVGRIVLLSGEVESVR